MNIKRAKEEIKDTIEAYLCKDEDGEYVIPSIRQRPVLLIGAPGIGKTQIMEQIARECQIGLVSYTITHHTRQSAIGLPFITHQEFGGKEYSITEYTMSEIVASVYEKIKKTGLPEGILFIDEVNCVSETLAPAMLQFLQCKTFGNHAIPKGWIIVAAGNPPEYNKSVREFDVVTLDRVKRIEVEPEYQVWKEYALREEIHPAIISYLDTRGQYFYKMETTVDGKRFATPRGWEDLSRLISVYEQLGKPVDWEVVIQYIQHEKIAKDFSNYLELYRKYRLDYQLDEIFTGHISERLVRKAQNASFDEKLGVISLLLRRCTEAFHGVCFHEEVMKLLFENLKLLKEGLYGAHNRQPLIYMRNICETFAEEWEQKREAELLNREGNRGYKKAFELLESYEKALILEDVSDGEAAFLKIRELFGEEKTALAAERASAGELLECAFDFMEAAFGESQEMVLFVTELNANYYSVQFLGTYECERYYYYNQSLLFEEGSRAIEAKLDELL
ncbi:MAG: AAA family ATPase [Fusicatenibacter sp.]|nr:AAA family ATPase [Lachnospiraceae bacterium]MDY2937872.1 AAA family ATPase [Fusicatenibacter sp.]